MLIVGETEGWHRRTPTGADGRDDPGIAHRGLPGGAAHVDSPRLRDADTVAAVAARAVRAEEGAPARRVAERRVQPRPEHRRVAASLRHAARHRRVAELIAAACAEGEHEGPRGGAEGEPRAAALARGSGWNHGRRAVTQVPRCGKPPDRRRLGARRSRVRVARRWQVMLAMMARHVYATAMDRDAFTPAPSMPRAAASGIPIADTTFVALDLEATGVAFGHDRIIEVGAARFRVDATGRVEPGPTFHTLVDPGLRLPPLIAELTGLRPEDLDGAPPLSAVWDDLTAFLDGAVVLAHQAQADVTWLASEALRLAAPPPAAPFFCTLRVARRCLPSAPRHTLAALVEHAGLRPGTHHRALADALHTRNLFAHCVGRVGARHLGAVGLDTPERWPEAARFEVRLPAHLEGLREAIAAAAPIEIRYRGGSQGSAFRPVTPLGLFAAEGVAYLRAVCHLAGDARSFRCDRIRTWRLEGAGYG